MITSYYSLTDAVSGANSGLVGGVIVTKRGLLKHKKDGDGVLYPAVDGINNEFTVLFSIMDENKR